LLQDKIKEYDFPVLKTYDFGHKCPTTFLPIGSKVKLDASSKEIYLKNQYLK